MKRDYASKDYLREGNRESSNAMTMLVYAFGLTVIVGLALMGAFAVAEWWTGPTSVMGALPCPR